MSRNCGCSPGANRLDRNNDGQITLDEIYSKFSELDFQTVIAILALIVTTFAVWRNS